MKMFGRLLVLFLIVPAIELALLIQVGRWVGFWPTIGLILFTGVAGSYLAKREGFSVWRKFNETLSRGGLPGKELLDGIIILCAGVMLLAPGVLTDVVGLLGLFPPTRALIRRVALRRIDRGMRTGTIRVGLFGCFGGGSGFGTPVDRTEGTWTGTPSEVPHYTDRTPPAPPPKHLSKDGDD